MKRSMPRFYLHLYNDVEVRDDEGVDLPDLESARLHATRQVLFTLAETVKERGRIVLSHRVDIEDGQGTVLATVRFGDVVEIES